ncbi:MAG: hypothetical protein ACE5DU_08860 [Nitrosopumilus sp.]
MNKKIITRIAITSILIASMGVITVLKPTMSNDTIELPGEEEMEKTFNFQEENERGETTAEEIEEHGEK